MLLLKETMKKCFQEVSTMLTHKVTFVTLKLLLKLCSKKLTLNLTFLLRSIYLELRVLSTISSSWQREVVQPTKHSFTSRPKLY